MVSAEERRAADISFSAAEQQVGCLHYIRSIAVERLALAFVGLCDRAGLIVCFFND